MSFPILAPLVFASSAFVAVDTMPGWLQPFATYQPVSVAVDAVRSLMLGGQFHDPARVVAVPATELALRHVGRPVPNAALLGAFAALTGVVYAWQYNRQGHRTPIFPDDKKGKSDE